MDDGYVGHLGMIGMIGMIGKMGMIGMMDMMGVIGMREASPATPRPRLPCWLPPAPQAQAGPVSVSRTRAGEAPPSSTRARP